MSALISWKDKWVEDALILYVGASNDLQRRINELIDFGNGKDVAHHGGRYLWQIEGADYLQVCWKVVQNEKQEETKMLEAFKRLYQDKPALCKSKKLGPRHTHPATGRWGHRTLNLPEADRPVPGVDEGNRALIFSLEGCCSTTELHLRRRLAEGTRFGPV